MKMTWEIIAQLILQIGFPLANEIIGNWLKGAAPPTAEQWDALQAKAQLKARDKMLAVLAQAGIDPASDQGKAFLALVG